MHLKNFKFKPTYFRVKSRKRSLVRTFIKKFKKNCYFCNLELQIMIIEESKKLIEAMSMNEKRYFK